MCVCVLTACFFLVFLLSDLINIFTPDVDGNALFDMVIFKMLYNGIIKVQWKFLLKIFYCNSE